MDDELRSLVNRYFQVTHMLMLLVSNADYGLKDEELRPVLAKHAVIWDHIHGIPHHRMSAEVKQRWKQRLQAETVVSGELADEIRHRAEQRGYTVPAALAGPTMLPVRLSLYAWMWTMVFRIVMRLKERG